ncbi:peptide deformylase [soil metagenome]
MTTIKQKDSKVLREIALEVPLDEIQSKKIQDILSVMKATLKGEEDGVAIAAPQIGKSLRIFIVSGRATLLIQNIEITPGIELPPDVVFINPVITKLSKTKATMEEGCLSVRWLYGKVERSTKATIEAYDEKGKKFQKGASGLMAQIFQHETDHLNGVLFIDKATDVEDLPPTLQPS